LRQYRAFPPARPSIGLPTKNIDFRRCRTGNRPEASAPEVARITMESHWLDVEQRSDGAVLVRMHSRDQGGQPLPDAVFTFRRGDPQYEYWYAKCQQQKAAEPRQR